MAVNSKILAVQASKGMTNTPAQQAATKTTTTTPAPVANTSSPAPSTTGTSSVNPKIVATQVANGMTNTPAINSYNNSLASQGLTQNQSAVYNPSLNPSLTQPNQPAINLNNVPNTANNMDAYTKLMESQTKATQDMLAQQAKTTQEMLNKQNEVYKKNTDALQAKLDSLNSPNQKILDSQAKDGRFGTPAQNSAGNQQAIQEQNKANFLNQINNDYRVNPNIFADEKTFQQHYGYEQKNSTERIAMMQAFHNIKGDLSGYNSNQLVKGLQNGDFSKSQLDNLKNTNPVLYETANSELRVADDEKYYNELALNSNLLQERLAKNYEPVNAMMQMFTQLAVGGTNVAEISNMYLKEENEHPELKDINNQRNSLHDKIKEITRDQESLEKDTYKAAPGVSKSVLRAEMNEDMIALEKRKKDLYDEDVQLERREQQIRKDMEVKYKILSNNAQIENEARQQKMQALQFSTNIMMDLAKQQNDIAIGDYNFQRSWAADMKKLEIQNNLELQKEKRQQDWQIASENRAYERQIASENRAENRQIAGEKRQLENKGKEFEMQIDYTKGNVNSSNEYIRNQGITNAVLEVYKQYDGLIISSPKQMEDRIKGRMAQGASFSTVMGEIMHDIQSKPNFKQYMADKSGVNTKPFQVGDITYQWDGDKYAAIYDKAQADYDRENASWGGDSGSSGGSSGGGSVNIDRSNGASQYDNVGFINDLKSKYLNKSSNGLQCAGFVCTVDGKGLVGNTLQEKINYVKKVGESPVPVIGGIAAIKTDQKYGHVGYVSEISKDGKQVKILASNNYGTGEKPDGKVTEKWFNISSVSAFSKAQGKEVPKASNGNNSSNSGYNTNLVPSYEDYIKTGAVPSEKMLKQLGVSYKTFVDQAGAYKNSLNTEAKSSQPIKINNQSIIDFNDDTTRRKMDKEVVNQLATQKNKIMSNPGSDISEILKWSQGGKNIGDTQYKELQKFETALSQIGDIQNQLKAMDTGPIIGELRKLNPYDTQAQVLKSKLTALVPTMARGVYGEVGVLTDADIKNYTQTIPNLTSTEDKNKGILAFNLDLLAGSYKSKLANLAGAGYDVSGMEGAYRNVKAQADALRAEIGFGTKGQMSSQSKTTFQTNLSNFGLKPISNTYSQFIR